MRKTLIVSSYAPPAIGGPQNLYNLLKDADPTRYGVLTSFYNIDPLSARVGSWLPGEYFFYDATKTKHEAQNGAAESQRTVFSRIKHLVKRSAPIRLLLSPAIIGLQIFAIYKAGKNLLKSGNTEVLMAVSDYGPALIASYYLHRATKTPLILFMFDLYKANFLPFPGSLLARYYEKRIFAAAEKIIVTNAGTKEYYERLYSPDIVQKLTIIHNSAFAPSVIPTEHTPKEPFTILYTGRIYWPQIGALKNLVEAVRTLDLPVQLKIYAPHPAEYLRSLGISGPHVSLSVAAPDHMFSIQSQADILFLPLSWNTKSQSIIDTATPGKLTDYLNAGRPILVHAPATSFLARYTEEHECALVVDSNSVKELQDGIKTLIVNHELARRLVVNARKTFTANHDARTNAQLLQTILS